MDYTNEKEDVVMATSSKPSNLNQSLEDLIQMIFNIDMMNKQMKEIGYNATKLPLGKLGRDTLQKGYAALMKIEDVLQGKERGDLYELSSEFYSHIPHSFGFKYVCHNIAKCQISQLRLKMMSKRS
jgi:poly [ADP-ribose] polymerase